MVFRLIHKLLRTWYPNENVILNAHAAMLNEFGGFTGFETGLDVFGVILKEVKGTKGIYKKAAVFLKRLVEVRIFCDGNHRTACLVTDMFLRLNGEIMKIRDQQNIITFIKDIKQYNIDEIEAWLKNGKTPERSS